MRTAFFPILGRWGNILFQYAHARAWCEYNGYTLSMHPWIGEKVFEIPEAVRPGQIKPDMSFGENYYQDQASLIYTRKQVREWFTFKPEIEERLRILAPSSLLFNVREGSDYLGAGNVMISKHSYKDAAHRAGYDFTLADWETDTNPTRFRSFPGDMYASGLGVTMAALPSFYRLMAAKVLFRANSTFSFWAATLNTKGKIYSPVIKGLKGGVPDMYCNTWVEGNYPMMTESSFTSDLHFSDE